MQQLITKLTPVLNDLVQQESEAHSVAPNKVAPAANDDPEIARLERKIAAAKQAKTEAATRAQRVAELQAELARIQATKVVAAPAPGPAPAPAEVTPITRALLTRLPRGKRENRDGIAVILGNGEYTTHHPDVPNVAYAHNDAEAIKEYVLHTLRFRQGNLIFVEDATKGQMESIFGTRDYPEGKLAHWIRQGRSDVFVFYSGHGAPGLKNGEPYLVPVDADPATLEINGYPVATLYHNLAALHARSITVVLDACFSGGSAGGAVVKHASDLVIRPTMPSAALPKGTVITASDGTQIASWDEEAHLGLLTRYFLEGIAGAADQQRYGNGDGKVALAELKRYLDSEVVYRARRAFGRDQTPEVTGDMTRVMAVVGR